MITDSPLMGQLLHGTLLLLAIVNPVGNIPVYVHLTASQPEQERHRTLNYAMLTAMAMVVIFALIGDWSLRHLFQVTLDEFKIAGGILLFFIAAKGVLSSTVSYQGEEIDTRFLAIFPLAFPVMVGPGSLAITIILSQRYGAMAMILICLATFAIVYLVAHASYQLMRVAGPYAGLIVARLLYLFLAAKAVSLVLSSVKTYFHL